MLIDLHWFDYQVDVFFLILLFLAKTQKIK